MQRTTKTVLTLALFSMVSGCTKVESKLAGTWYLDQLTHRENEETTTIDYPLSRYDYCVELNGQDPEDCERWGYSEDDTQEMFYIFSNNPERLTLVMRECVGDSCQDESITMMYSTYELDDETYLSMSSYSYYSYGGSAVQVGFEDDALKLADVGWDCEDCDDYYYYYYYYEDDCVEGCTEDTWVWKFSKYESESE